MSKRLMKFMSKEERRSQRRTAAQAKRAREAADKMEAEHAKAQGLNIARRRGNISPPTSTPAQSSNHSAGYTDV